jgi:enolase-phosphatase E1
MRGPRVVLTDIEGTTSSLSFVRDVLFPFARARLPEFVRRHRHDPTVRTHLEATARDANLEPDNIEGAIATLLAWIDADRKATPLKALQGMIWQEGYAAGAYTAHVYDDAIVALRAWHAQGRKLYVYSSGSVPAQKLYFAHTTVGDLTPLFSGYFDTTTGPKKEADSYRAIARAVGVDASTMVFLSDLEGEVDAARDAGLRTVWVRRDLAKTPATHRDHRVVRSFAEIKLDAL